MKEEKFLIYKIENKINGKIYIGQTVRSLEKRWRQHCEPNNDKCRVLHRAIKAHGKMAFDVCVLDDTATSVEDLNNLEIKYIKEYDCLAPKGYNLTTGGSSYTMSEETKKKISEAKKGKPGNKGRIVSEETRKKNSEWKRQHPNSEETNKKIGEANKGKRRTDEQKLKWTGENNPFYGKTHSEETRKHLSEKHTGKVLSEEWKNKIGNAVRGENNGNTKLTNTDVKLIKCLLNNGFSERATAKIFNLGSGTVHRISAGETWKHIN